MASRRRTPEQIAALLVFAEEHGDRAACIRFRISRTTLWRCQKRSQVEPAVKQAATAATEKVHRAWLDEAGAARSKILDSILADLEKATTTVREKVGALKIVSDSMLAEKVLTDGGQPVDRPGLESEGQAHPGAAAAGGTASVLQ